MRKRDELSNPDSCLNRAADDELIFVIRGHDVAGPDTIRNWVANRVSGIKNNLTDPQIKEALKCADQMEAEQRFGNKRSCPYCFSELGLGDLGEDGICRKCGNVG